MEAKVGTLVRAYPLKNIAFSLGVLIWSAFAGLQAHAEGIAPFVGNYVGSANLVDEDGSETPRDMSVSI